MVMEANPSNPDSRSPAHPDPDEDSTRGVGAAGAIERTRARTHRPKAWAFLALLGPGVIASISGNDSGGMMSYAMTGATFGISFFLPLLFLLAPIGYTMQEMSMRLSAVTHREYRELVLRRFGRFWSGFSVSALAGGNLLYLITEFAGMTTGLTLIGLPLWLADAVSLVFVCLITLLMGYRQKERFSLVISAVNIVFIVVAFLTHPDASSIAAAFSTWPRISWNAAGNGMPVFIMATVGNCMAPFMLFFQSSASIDRRMTERDLRSGRADISIGAVLQPLFGAAAMLCGAAVCGKIAHLSSAGPADLVSALIRVTGRWGGALFAIGLFNAGWLSAITISFSTAYTVSGAFGWKRSLRRTVAEEPRFYALYYVSLLIAALIILIPGLPLGMLSVFTQIIVSMLFIPDLAFLVVLTGDRKIMGDHSNPIWKQAMGWGIVVIFAIASVVTIGAGLM